MKWVVHILHKKEVLDTQSRSIKQVLQSKSEYKPLSDLQLGKWIVVDIDESDEEKGRALVMRMAKEVLCNPLVERFSVRPFESGAFL